MEEFIAYYRHAFNHAFYNADQPEDYVKGKCTPKTSTYNMALNGTSLMDILEKDRAYREFVWDTKCPETGVTEKSGTKLPQSFKPTHETFIKYLGQKDTNDVTMHRYFARIRAFAKIEFKLEGDMVEIMPSRHLKPYYENKVNYYRAAYLWKAKYYEAYAIREKAKKKQEEEYPF